MKAGKSIRNSGIFIFFILFVLAHQSTANSNDKNPQISFQVVLKPELQTFHVTMKLKGINKDTILLKMPAWTPGYYQLLHFADQVSGVTIKKSNEESITFQRSGRNAWKFATGKETDFTIQYAVKATRSFVANPFLDSTHGYIAPTGVFMHVSGLIRLPASVTLQLPEGWTAATGLETSKQSKHQFLASDFDILYDSPILLGPLEELPSFEVRGVPHRFIGYKPGTFDRKAFIDDLKKIVEAGVNIIGDIPYKHYTFLAIGPGPGGIEHLNSTTFGFSADALKTDKGRKRMYTFLAHEYFHHYNVKRIRPVELGPFDYDNENHTNMLWVSEGFTVYYDELISRHAGLITDSDLYEGIRSRLLGYENKPGRFYQSATQASYNTWSDGPFGRADDEVNKTISVYDKGCILGLMLDFNIRHVTANKKSLDHVMQILYKEFYQKKKRGFTENEFQTVCEQVAGVKLTELFGYASTVAPIDYKKYFAYGGLDIDTEPKQVEGAWLGLATRLEKDSIVVTDVEFESPAWNAGIRKKMRILKVDGADAKTYTLAPIMPNQPEGKAIRLQYLDKGQTKEVTVEPGKKVEPDYKISPLNNPTVLQQQILKSWLTGKR